MKIAFVSDDGITISRHFGRARQYVIVTIEEGQETARELRVKPDDQPDAQGHGDPQQDWLLTTITDCQMIVAGGMGASMDDRLRAAGLTPIRTRIQAVDLAVERFLGGRLTDTIELVR